MNSMLSRDRVLMSLTSCPHVWPCWFDCNQPISMKTMSMKQNSKNLTKYEYIIESLKIIKIFAEKVIKVASLIMQHGRNIWFFHAVKRKLKEDNLKHAKPGLWSTTITVLDICTCFACYLYFAKQSWIINAFTLLSDDIPADVLFSVCNKRSRVNNIPQKPKVSN